MEDEFVMNDENRFGSTQSFIQKNQSIMKQIYDTGFANIISMPIPNHKTDARKEQELEEKKNLLLKDKLCIVEKGQIKLIDYKDIVFCMSDGNYTIIQTQSGKKHLVSKTLSVVADQIDNPLFLRVHQSYFINTSYILLIDFTQGMRITMRGIKDQIPVSRSRHKTIKAIFS